MDNVKVRLSITLPGSVIPSKQECFKQLKKVYKDKKGNKKVDLIEEPIPEMFDFSTMRYKNSNTGKIETISIKIPKCRPALKVINLTSEAYNYMISTESPSWVKSRQWYGMTKQQRLENHLKRIAESNGGKVADYQILDD